MLVKVITHIILDVSDDEEAEEACHAMNMLDSVMRNNSFPHEVLDASVDHYEKVSDEEAEEQGWVE
jgi:hypothetical protein